MPKYLKHFFLITATELQKKWKNIRDSYSREIKNKRKVSSGSAAESRKEYVYYKQLQFLSRLFNTKRQEDKDNDENSVASPRTPSTSTPSTSSSAAPVLTTTTTKKRKVSPDDDSAALMSVIAEKIEAINSQPKCDPDMHFILSLYDDFHKIPSEKKIDAKMELMSIIKKYNDPTYQPNTYQYGYYTRNMQAQLNNLSSQNEYDSRSSAQSNYSNTLSDFDIDTHMFDDVNSSLP